MRCSLRAYNLISIMKIEILLHISFISCFTLLPSISTNTTTPQFQTAEAHVLKNRSESRVLTSSTPPLRNYSSGLAKLMKVGSNDSLSPIDGDVSVNETPRLGNPFHVLKIKPGYLRKQYKYQLDEKPTDLDEPPFYQNFNNFLKLLNYKFKREPYFDPYMYPPFYHRSHFKDYNNHAYRPHSSYGIPDFEKRFTNRRNNLVNYLQSKRGVNYPGKAFSSLDSAADATDTNQITSLSSSSSKSNFPGRDFVMAPNVIPAADNGTSDKSKIARDTSKVTAWQQENRSEITPNYAADVASTEISFGNATQDRLAGVEYFDDERAVANTDKLNIPSSNRVYYERIPQNLNLSWFVYANCSREKCQLTNSTNETELLNGGWIVHNCTNYGCTEMYPKTESTQKFIGLILLVFSVCVLKIVVFLLVFYYCRRIKISKQRSEDHRDLLSDEEEATFDISSVNKEDGRRLSMKPLSKHGAKHDKDPELPHTNDDDDQVSRKGSKHSPVYRVLEPDRENSKIWIPSTLVQKVSPCLVTSRSDGDISNPKKRLEKKTSNVKRSEAKRIRKTRDNTPGLMKRIRSRPRNCDGASEVMKGNDAIYFKASKRANAGVGDGEEVLLMDLDEESDTGGLSSRCNVPKPPKWGALLMEESASFVNLDLADDECSGK